MMLMLVGSGATLREWGSVVQLSDYLGVPVQTIYDWRSRKVGPPACKVGRFLRYRESVVIAWLDDQTAA